MKDKIYPITESDDIYDQDILTKRKCPECGALIISHPDCTESCSNEECEFERR
jgi:hypothetical protein